MHANAARVALTLRGAAALVGALDNFTVGLLTKRSAALPLAQLAAFKVGPTSGFALPLLSRYPPLTLPCLSP